MDKVKFISICIPAYKRTTFLKRLLDSIAIQTFKDFEVVITDDSNDTTVENFISHYKDIFTIIYYKNPSALGSPENWNAAIRKATGKWIKIMHDDDWFVNENSLALFFDAIQHNPDKEFFFSGFNNVQDNRIVEKIMLKPHKEIYIKNPLRLINENIIGPPSVTIYKSNPQFLYDRSLKWLVDIDFYIQYLTKAKYHYINNDLVNIGLSSEQVTQTAFRVATVEIPEHFHLLNKIGLTVLKDIIVYDAFWRLMRNLKIMDVEGIQSAGYVGEIPQAVIRILNIQKKMPLALLRNGFISKLGMTICYCYSYIKKEFIH